MSTATISPRPLLPPIALPTPESETNHLAICVVLDVACQEAGVSGYALFEFDQTTRRFQTATTKGMPAAQRPHNWLATRHPDPITTHQDGGKVITFPLEGEAGLGGLLEFAFAEGTQVSTSAHTTLQHAARAAEQYLLGHHRRKRLSDIADRLVHLQRRLADWKIQDRASGLLADGVPAGSTALLHAHVTAVLKNADADADVAEALAERYEAQLRDRNLLNQAKARLRQTYQLSEEEAYLLLRRVSRARRSKLRDIAKAVLSGHLHLTPESITERRA